MFVEVVREWGYTQALYGLSLSYNKKDINEYSNITDEDIERIGKVAQKLAFKSGGENKFLRMINVYVLIKAPLYWWKQYDTYKVGTVTQSESTMHTIATKQFKKEDFQNYKKLQEYPEFNNTLVFLNNLTTQYLTSYNVSEKQAIFHDIIAFLPDSFLQARFTMLNYAVLQNIIANRINHKLPEWQYFCYSILNQVTHSELLTKKHSKEGIDVALQRLKHILN